MRSLAQHWLPHAGRGGQIEAHHQVTPPHLEDSPIY